MRIVFAGGGTLGPVTPLLAVASSIKAADREVECFWIGTTSGPEQRVVADFGMPFFSVSSGKFRRYWDHRNFSDLLRIFFGMLQSLRLLWRLHPDVVVSAGGFVAVPVIWAAAILRVPIHVHQQDVRPGLTTRLTAPFAKSMSVAFERSLKDFEREHPVWTGNPVRQELFDRSRKDAAALFGFDHEVPTVLVLGGGTGSASINALVRDSLPQLGSRAQVIHSTGANKEAVASHPRYRPYTLLRGELGAAYALADVVVARCGIGTLSEIAALGRAAILVPIAESHQEENAWLFSDAGAALYLDERDLDAQSFSETILDLLDDADRRRSLAQAASRLMKRDAAAAIAKIVMDDAGR